MPMTRCRTCSVSCTKLQGGTTLDGATYTYDAAGNRNTRTPKPTDTALTYTYDNIYQLQTAKQGATTKRAIPMTWWGIGCPR